MKIPMDHRGQFEPITLSITMESMDELCTIFSVFNHLTITNFVEKYCGDNITENIRDALSVYGELPYTAFFNELYKAIKGEYV